MESEQVPIKIDIKVESADLRKCINKLIDTISAPFRWRAKFKEPIELAKADVEAALIRAKAIGPLSQELGISKDDALSLVLRADQRDRLMMIRRQANIENIIENSARLLPNSVDEEPVDEDWTVNFFEQCQDIGDKEMQTLWARILAGEVSKPGSYSKRTLQFLKTLEKAEAEKFTEFCSFVFKGGDHWFFVFDNEVTSKFIEEKLGPGSYMDHFSSIGLVGPESIGQPSAWINRQFYYFDQPYRTQPVGGKLQKHAFDLEPPFAFRTFTSIGMQLVTVAGGRSVDNYVDEVSVYLEQRVKMFLSKTV